MILPDQTGILANLMSRGTPNPVGLQQFMQRPAMLQNLIPQGTGYQQFYGQTPFQVFQQQGFPGGGADWRFAKKKKKPRQQPANRTPATGIFANLLNRQPTNYQRLTDPRYGNWGAR